MGLGSLKIPKCHINRLIQFFKYSITVILFICFLSFVVFYKLFCSHATSYIFIPSQYNENIFMGDQFLYLFINFSINYLLNS